MACQRNAQANFGRALTSTAATLGFRGSTLNAPGGTLPAFVEAFRRTEAGQRSVICFNRVNVGDENFIIWLDERTYLAVEFVTLRGSVVSFIVRLMRKDVRGDSILSRFDTAHGTPHQDFLTPSGNLRKKEWMLDASLNEALTRAIRHFKAHYEDYQD